jgi:hypothetical protein
MRIPFLEWPEDPGWSQSEQELRRFVSMMVHDLGHRVHLIRSLAESLQQEPGLRSKRVRSRLDALAQAADDLAMGLRIMRSTGSGDDPLACEFVPDVMQPAASLALRGRSRARLLIDPTARELGRVRLRAGMAVLAIARLITSRQPDTIRCTASRGNRTVIINLEFLSKSGSAVYAADSELEGLLREAGVLSVHVTPAEGGRLTTVLNIGVAP